jgi:hypothetical protein
LRPSIIDADPKSQRTSTLHVENGTGRGAPGFGYLHHMRRHPEANPPDQTATSDESGIPEIEVVAIRDLSTRRRTFVASVLVVMVAAGVLTLLAQSGPDHDELSARDLVAETTPTSDSDTSTSTAPEETVVDTTGPDSTTPDSTTPDSATASTVTTPDPVPAPSSTDAPEAPPTTADPTAHPPTYLPQDIYGDICEPLGWTNCAEYRIYDATGLQVNQVIGNSDWSLAYIAEASGGGADGSAVKVRDILPCAPGECVSYTH